MNPGRRDFLRAVPLAALGTAGCGGSQSHDDLTVTNRGPEQVTVSVRVVGTRNDRERLDETVRLEPDARTVYASVVGTREARIEVDVRNGPGDSFEWADDEDDSLKLLVSLEPGSISFTTSSGPAV